MKIAVRLGAAALGLLLLGGAGFVGVRYFRSSERAALPASQQRAQAPAPDRQRQEVKPAQPPPEPVQPKPAAAAPAKPAAAAPAATTPPAPRDAGQERLIRLYEGMRPKEAAAVMVQLDPGLSAAFLFGMRERQAAKILGQLPPKKAAELITRMGQLKRVPEADPAAGQPRTEGRS